MPASLRCAAAITLCSVIFVSGCGGKGRELPKAPVSGTVTYKDGKLPDGMVIFMHPSGEMTSVNFGADGAYKVQVAQGKNEVLVKSAEISGGGMGPKDGNKAQGMEIHKSRIPDKYMMPGQSGLTVDVKAGENKYDIKLE